MSDSAYLWSKPLKSEFYFSGLPEKACQGCHISKWVPRNFAICTSNWRILDPWLIAIVGFHGTKIWFVQNCDEYILWKIGIEISWKLCWGLVYMPLMVLNPCAVLARVGDLRKHNLYITADPIFVMTLSQINS